VEACKKGGSKQGGLSILKQTESFWEKKKNRFFFGGGGDHEYEIGNFSDL